ncbi:sigma-E factor negative regulatory protein [Undibacterium sp. TS12]|uniref:sigma-E factor negative regulatory protein n=1 Tax=Undibacterium sp. TS12 TaxID=2908202 RepID=UPI001F4C5696|nr:sigma-E factor negative regulatory protein [Undibacterium sp. TS12]MCH8618474.1 sigma-E factor negative regulatory protein [Undibacterium sp. TS12]
MDKSINQHESISAMADGELSDAQLDALLAGLNKAECKDAWEVYHQIGDVLRSDELAITFSADFSKKLSEKLDAEPVIFAPSAMQRKSGSPENSSEKKKRFLGAYAAVASVAAAAIFAFIMVPQLDMSRSGGDSMLQANSKLSPASNVQMASHNEGANLNALALGNQVNQSSEKNGQVKEKKGAEIEMLRDPRIDSYLLAHQRFSPTINAGAQYVTHANAVTPAAEK